MSTKKIVAGAFIFVVTLMSSSEVFAASAPKFNSFHGGFEKTANSVTLPVQFNNAKGSKVTIKVEYTDVYASNKKKIATFSKLLDIQHGDTFVTVNKLNWGTLYKFRLKVNNSSWSRSYPVTTASKN